MTTTTDTATTHVYRVYIKAPPEAVWDAITKPEWSEKYGYTGLVDYDLRPGGTFQAVAGPAMEASGITGVLVDGEVIEVDPPRRLVQTWRLRMDPALEAEGFTRLSYDIKQIEQSGTRLTVTHELGNAPGLTALLTGELEDTGAGGGWAWVLSDLKSVLETGKGVAA